MDTLRYRWGEQESSKSLARSLRYRAAIVEKTDLVCSCGMHRAIKLSNVSGQVLHDRTCPVAWWLACAKPTTFSSREERSVWVREHPVPTEDWEGFVDTLVKRI